MSLTHEAFDMYKDTERAHWQTPQGVSSPPELTFDNWVKTSGNIDYWQEMALKRRKGLATYDPRFGWKA